MDSHLAGMTGPNHLRTYLEPPSNLSRTTGETTLGTQLNQRRTIIDIMMGLRWVRTGLIFPQDFRLTHPTKI